MTYCISDIHGCYAELMELLKQIKFNPPFDTLYILGDVIDRGSSPLDCINFIMNTQNIHFTIGNHEQMMLDYYAGKDFTDNWKRNGNKTTKVQLNGLQPAERENIFAYLRKCPYYRTIHVNGQQYFLSHSGLDVSLPFECQSQEALIWSREEFYEYKALEDYICVFGHTPTAYLNGSTDCSVWYDKEYNDKICIDCGCVYGGALAALRLDDGEIFYVKTKSK